MFQTSHEFFIIVAAFRGLLQGLPHTIHFSDGWKCRHDDQRRRTFAQKAEPLSTHRGFSQTQTSQSPLIDIKANDLVQKTETALKNLKKGD